MNIPNRCFSGVDQGENRRFSMARDGGELSLMLDRVTEQCPKDTSSSRSTSRSSNMSDRFDEKTDLPDLDEFQNARFAGELADCPEDIEVLRTAEFQSLLKPLHQEQTRMMRRRSTMQDVLGGDLTSIVVANRTDLEPQTAAVKRGGVFTEKIDLGKQELELRRQVRERLRHRRDTTQVKGGSGSLAFAQQNKPPGCTDGGEDTLDERPRALSKTDQIQTGRRTSGFATMVGRNFLFK